MSTVSDQVILDWSGSQSVGPDAGYTIPWTTETLDASNYWVIGTPERATVPTGKAGIHYATYTYSATAGTGFRAFGQILVYNSSNVFQREYRGPMGRDDAITEVSALTKLNDGDYIICGMYFSSNARTINAAHLDIVRFS